MKPQPRVYYAAGLFNEAERAFNREVVTMLHELGYSTWFPQEDVGVLGDFIEQGMTLAEARDHIFRMNIREVAAADLIVLVLDGRVPDEGACIEAGVGFGMNKRLIGLKTDFRDAEPGGNNLMIDGILDYQIAGSIDELRQMLHGRSVTIDLTEDEPVVTLGTSVDDSEAIRTD